MVHRDDRIPSDLTNPHTVERSLAQKAIRAAEPDLTLLAGRHRLAFRSSDPGLSTMSVPAVTRFRAADVGWTLRTSRSNRVRPVARSRADTCPAP